MERAEWLKHMRSITEALYDQLSPAYWVKFGLYENEAQLTYLQKFLARVSQSSSAGQPSVGGPTGVILSAACGAGRYDGILLEAGYPVAGIDQSAGMLEQAREHFPPEQFPQARYEQMGLQEMDFHEEFVGAICMDALEHVCPEDWPGILQGFSAALKPGGLLYFNVELPDVEEVEESYRRAKAMGLPVVYGELADEVEASYQRVKALSQQPSGEQADVSVYHYYPSLEQVRAWLEQANLAIEEEGPGSGYYHIIARKK